jgi:hypothetical protein
MLLHENERIGQIKREAKSKNQAKQGKDLGLNGSGEEIAGSFSADSGG